MRIMSIPAAPTSPRRPLILGLKVIGWWMLLSVAAAILATLGQSHGLVAVVWLAVLVWGTWMILHKPRARPSV